MNGRSTVRNTIKDIIPVLPVVSTLLNRLKTWKTPWPGVKQLIIDLMVSNLGGWCLHISQHIIIDQ